MANLYDKRVRLEAKKFNKKRVKLLPLGIECKLLLKQGLVPGSYTELYDVTDWWYYHNSFREKTIVQVASLDTEFREALVIASDVQIGEVIYEIDVRDIQQPDANRPYWQFSGAMNVELY